jgi:putative transposase
MAHSYSSIIVHIVFATLDRRAQIDSELEERLYPYLGGILRELGGNVLAVNGVPDHLHLLGSVPTSKSLAEVVGKIKGSSSKWIHDTFPCRSDFAWQRGYGAFSVSPSQVARVVRYIERQKIHHSKVSFRDEFIRLLRSHGIATDERYLWT